MLTGMTTGANSGTTMPPKPASGLFMCQSAAPDLLGHADTVAGVAGRPLPVDRPAGKELLLHFEIELKSAAAQDHAFVRLDVIGLARDFGHDAGNLLGRRLDQRLGRRFVHHFHLPLLHLFRAEGNHSLPFELPSLPQVRTQAPPGSSGCSGWKMPSGVLLMPSVASQSFSFIISLGKRLDALLVGEAVAERVDVLERLREVRGRPPHIARDLAVASLAVPSSSFRG